MHPGAQVVKEATLQCCNVASCNRTYREISKAAASKSVCKPVATPKVSKGRSESPLVASAEAKPCKTEKARRPFSLPSTRNPFLVENPIRIKRWAPKVSKGRSESPLVASAEAKPCETEKARRTFPLPSTRNPFSCRKPYPHQEVGPEGFQRAIGKPFGRLRRGEILCETEKSKEPLFPSHPQGTCSL